MLTSDTLMILRDRAHLLAKSRQFFAERDVLEVDVPSLSFAASVDCHIDLIEAHCLGKKAYLHSSPEYGMKRLLAQGSCDIYQMSHVFRDYERGERHTVEFMMTEWYRVGFTLQQMIEESCAYLGLFLSLPSPEVEMLRYKEAFIYYAGSYPETTEERDALFGFEVEPHLGTRQKLTVVTCFPPEQAALARLDPEGYAERFEVFYKGVELANGYHELIDAQEQRARLITENTKRALLGKNTYPLDEDFLAALNTSMPDCCGVAVGFDRALMLRHKLEEIRETTCFFI